MICWPSYLVGAFTISLIIFDLIQNDWSSLPYHSLIGILLTLFLFGLCWLVGPNITGAVLVVPALAIGIFALGVLFTGYTLRKKGCCVKCGEEPVPAEPQESCAAPVPEEPSCPNELKATRIV
jgi:hypothetical protein